MRTFRDAETMAAILRAELTDRTDDECRGIVARQFGFDDWAGLAARIEQESRSRIVPRFLVDGLEIGDPRRATSTTISVLRIADEKRALAWYCDVLGFALDFGGPAGGPAGGPFFGQVIRGETTLRLSEEPGPAGGIVTVHLGDVDAVRAELAGRGADVPAVEEVFWGFRILYLTDPFGNELQLAEPVDAEQRAAVPRWT